MSRRRKSDPYFVEARILRDGSVDLIDDEGEIFNVMMRRDSAYPMLSRQCRRFELQEAYERRERANKPPQPPNSTPPWYYGPKLIA